MKRLFRLLRNRAARNIYLWIGLLWLAHAFNQGNEYAYHYGQVQRGWYWPLFALIALLQLLLVYTNNLLLIPRLLVRSKKGWYFLSAALWVVLVSLLNVLLLKLALPHIQVDKLQLPSYINSYITAGFSGTSIFSDIQTYIFGNAVWLLVFSMAWYMNDYARQRRLAEHARRQQTEMELAFLKSQLNPHFLFNTLNNLYALTLKKSELAPGAILKLSAILRYLLYESATPLVPFLKEGEIIAAYAALEQMRLKDASDIRLNVATDAPVSIPPLLWLPVLENAFKHGARAVSKDVYVHFEFTIAKGLLTINCTNMDKGSATAPTDAGIGLANLRKRLLLLYPGRHEISAGRNNGQFIVHISIQL